MKFAGHVFGGRVTFDAYQVYAPGTFNELPKPWQSLARWCERCWRLIPNGKPAYHYYRFDLCRPCHYKISKNPD